MGSDERAVHETHTSWIDAVNAGDLVRLLTLMTDDVVFLSPGRARFVDDHVLLPTHHPSLAQLIGASGPC